MAKRIRKFTVRTAGAAAVLMVVGFMPAIASAGPLTCAACVACLASCSATFGLLCPACILPCIGCPLPIP